MLDKYEPISPAEESAPLIEETKLEENDVETIETLKKTVENVVEQPQEDQPLPKNVEQPLQAQDKFPENADQPLPKNVELPLQAQVEQSLPQNSDGEYIAPIRIEFVDGVDANSENKLSYVCKFDFGDETHPNTTATSNNVYADLFSDFAREMSPEECGATENHVANDKTVNTSKKHFRLEFRSQTS